MKKSFGFFILSIMMMIGMGIHSFGAENKIEQVDIVFSYDKEPKSGDQIGAVSAKTRSQEFQISYAEYTNNLENWTVGDRPVVKLELRAGDGYRFYYTAKSRFTLTGGTPAFKKAKIYDDGAALELEVYLKRVEGKLASVQNMEWDGTRAVWDKLTGAKSYQVRLYRDNKVVETVETNQTNYDFYNSLNREGDYYFRVRAIASYQDQPGEWSKDSENNFIDQEGAKNIGKKEGWRQTSYGWWYAYANGSYPMNSWKNINHKWYYFNSDGYSLIGWQYINNRWYYLEGSGAMLTGWQYINDKWYYLDESGAMYANCRTPDGFYVDGSGVMIR